MNYNSSFLSPSELAAIGFAEVHESVQVHPSCVIVGAEAISLGPFVRIDPFCVVTANAPVRIGAYVHVGSHTFLSGAEGIEVGEFATISQGAHIFSVSDDGTRSPLLGPQVPTELRQLRRRCIVVEAHGGIGTGAVVLPGAHLREGAILGALSMAQSVLEPWTIYAGVPAQVVGHRDASASLAAAEKMTGRRG